VVAVLLTVLGAAWNQAAQGQCCTFDESTTFDYGDQEQAGHSVGVSGSDAVVGAPAAGPALTGGVRFYTKNGTWVDGDLVLPSDPDPDGQFGFAAALDGSFAVVGAPGHDDAGENAGRVYAFIRQPGPEPTWVEETHFTHLSVQPLDAFGIAVAISGTSLVVGASGTNQTTGAAYVYDRIGGVWTPSAVLLAPAGAPNDAFGVAVAMDGGVIVVGTAANPGRAHVFRRQPNGAWEHEQVLTSPLSQPGDEFGRAVAIDGNVVVVGARADSEGASFAGAAHVFGYGGPRGSGSSSRSSFRAVPHSSSTSAGPSPSAAR
jgi:hypothetical protein